MAYNSDSVDDMISALKNMDMDILNILIKMANAL